MGLFDWFRRATAPGEDGGASGQRSERPAHLSDQLELSQRLRERFREAPDGGGRPSGAVPCAPILEAAKVGDFQQVSKILVDRVTALSDSDDAGMTAIHKAACYGHTTVVVELLDRWHDNKDRRTASGRTPLHFAAWRGHIETCRALLERNADPNISSNDGWTPRAAAADAGFGEIADLLGASMREPNAPILSTQLTDAARRVMHEAGIDDETIDAGGNALLGATQIILAAVDNDLPTVRWLLKRASKEDVCAQTALGWTALHWASLHGNDAMSAALIEAGADPSIKNNNGETAGK